MARTLLLCLAAVFTSAEGNLSKHSLKDVDPHAKCTDGTAAAYYYKPSKSSTDVGSLKTSTTWIVYLQGGGWCYDKASCKSRCGTPDKPSLSGLCSSKGYLSSKAVAGLFWDTSSTLLQDVQKVFVPYCTSDGHMGNASAMGWQFRGQVVVQSVIRDLVAKHGLGSGKQKHTLIFGGGSAGARGAMVHLDYVSKMLGKAASNVDIVGFLDSPAWIDEKPFDSKFVGFPYITQHVHNYANVEHLGEECAAKYSKEPWKCMFGQYRLPTIKTPYFLVASLYDAYQLMNNVGRTPTNATEKAYAVAFANKTKELVKSISEVKPQNAVYSWACFNHCTSTSNGGYNTHTCGKPGTTMASAFHQFLGISGATKPKRMEWIDSCDGYACGTGCSAANDVDPTDIDLSWI